MKLFLEGVTRSFIMDRKFFGIKCAADVNEGDCYRWAYVAYCLYGGTLCSFENIYLSHAFIKIDNRYYDSESPDGEDDWKQLRFFRNSASFFGTTLVVEMVEDYFISYWDFVASDLNKLIARAKKIILQLETEYVLENRRRQNSISKGDICKEPQTLPKHYPIAI